MAHEGVELVRAMFATDKADRSTTILERRAAMDAMTKDVAAPGGVTVETTTLGGRPAERLVPDGRLRTGVVLYLHGGGYCLGGLSSHRELAGDLAHRTQRVVAVLDYRLAPEHPFPAAIDDALAAFEELRATTPGGAVALAGDSAGGGLAVAVAMALRDRGLPGPVAIACASPWVDLTQSLPSHQANADVDPTVTKWGLDMLADAYLAGHDAQDPLASPVFGDLRGLAPLRIDVGGTEVLLDDARALAEAAHAAGVDVTLHVWPELFHVFHAYPPEIVPEAPACRSAIVAHLDRFLSA